MDIKILTGTRGWNLLETENSNKMINRESIRLKLAIEDGIQRYGNDKEIIVFMHYPPITNSALLNKSELKFVETMKNYNVKKCFYGHLHSHSHKDAIEGNIENIEFCLISADYLDFQLKKIK